MPGLTQTAHSPPPLYPQHENPFINISTNPSSPAAPSPPPKPYSEDGSDNADAWLALFAYTGIGLAGAIIALIICCCTSFACR
jgi:hypothetical protein